MHCACALGSAYPQYAEALLSLIASRTPATTAPGEP